MSIGILQKRAIASAGGIEELRRKSERYYASLCFVEEHKTDLIKKYDGHWVAIYNSGIIASNEDLNNLILTINKEKAPLDEVLVEYLSSEDILTLY